MVTIKSKDFIQTQFKKDCRIFCSKLGTKLSGYQNNFISREHVLLNKTFASSNKTFGNFDTSNKMEKCYYRLFLDFPKNYG